MSRSWGLIVFCAALSVGTAGASAGIVTNDPDVVMLDVPYVSAVVANKATPKLLESVVKGKAIESRVADGPSAELLDIDFEIDALFQFAGPVIAPGSGTTTGTVRSVDLTGTGQYENELLNLAITLSTTEGPVMLRESPTLASIGFTDITPLGGGLFHVDSFFDVFFEVSTDGGQSWEPYSSAVHLTMVPEPSTMVLVAISAGLLVPGWRRYRRRGQLRKS
jgi:hypothetical protein